VFEHASIAFLEGQYGEKILATAGMMCGRLTPRNAAPSNAQRPT